jgi:hypothetical protein
MNDCVGWHAHAAVRAGMFEAIWYAIMLAPKTA